MDDQMNQMMQQAQAMQRKLAEAQEELAASEATGQAGGGMVTATVSGNREQVTGVSIDPEAVDPADVEMLADMVTAAVNDALRNAKQIEQQTLGAAAGGFDLPPGLM